MNINKTVLHHYSGTELIMFNSKSGKTSKLDGISIEEESVKVLSGNLLYSLDLWPFKPALHSMNRLTIPLENGEIPLIELAKICRPSVYWSGTEKDRAIGHSPVCDRYEFYYSDGSFYIIQDPSGFRDVPNQLECFQYLIKNHFNVFGLSESEYIEKSTLKL